MNKVEITGRLTADPEVRYTQGQNPLAVARFTVAVNRRYKKQNGPDADFIPVTAFGKLAEFVEKYFKKGMKAEVTGRIETDSYSNKEGKRVYTWGVTAEEIDFGESKNTSEKSAEKPKTTGYEGFMNIPDDMDEELPFV